MKAILVGGAMLLLGLAASARAADNEALRAQLARCAGVQDALQRLECFDRLSRSLGLVGGRAALPATAAAQAATAAPPTQQPVAPQPPKAAVSPAAPVPGTSTRQVDRWNVRIERDAKGRVHIVTVTSSAAAAKGVIGDPPVLKLRCMDSETAVAIDWENYVGNDSVPVTFGLDGGSQARADWSVSVNGMATSYPGKAAALARSLLGARQLDVKVTPYGGHQISARFDLAGLAAAIAPLRAACHW